MWVCGVRNGVCGVLLSAAPHEPRPSLPFPSRGALALTGVSQPRRSRRLLTFPLRNLAPAWNIGPFSHPGGGGGGRGRARGRNHIHAVYFLSILSCAIELIWNFPSECVPSRRRKKLNYPCFIWPLSCLVKFIKWGGGRTQEMHPHRDTTPLQRFSPWAPHQDDSSNNAPTYVIQNQKAFLPLRRVRVSNFLFSIFQCREGFTQIKAYAQKDFDNRARKGAILRPCPHSCRCATQRRGGSSKVGYMRRQRNYRDGTNALR
ncbi:hypothetical protein TbgDal_XI13430 [Trypanosoma brucei gambiense DAL972]|uniref:Uncharacterized protein n=1 Tax=Trypanosoma brucei gambiense (strain MHOM/CI/86/DAL972) TaxID=679716 RepID=D0A973_TRYB9|nr:hypothetical protein TbgDal_XI13430 [Trypanosoma brucei gambiense DAL972]CBH18224.1 hypothetical protein TbgDal_XI13430 [Trypanosoma brucei gambiense DAL972]|eukprot:XP_011780488.1 hypothetical protein TbgDal_XI13430 [Trypanosoma brucei gambiense DAL972]